MTGRYATHGTEGQAQPGSRGRVLANRLGIVRVRDMQVAETAALLQLTDDLLGEITEAQRFTGDDLCAWHQRWLGGIYDWAGHYRNVNMSKDGFPFAAARLVPDLMADYTRRVLAAHTPCAGMDDARLVQALAQTHAEFILIHPFREGNGRLARLLNTMMALQAGLPLLDFDGIRGGCQAAVHRLDPGGARPRLRTPGAGIRRRAAANPAGGYFFLRGCGSLSTTVRAAPFASVTKRPVAALRNVAAETPSMADELRTFRSTAAFRLAGV